MAGSIRNTVPLSRLTQREPNPNASQSGPQVINHRPCSRSETATTGAFSAVIGSGKDATVVEWTLIVVELGSGGVVADEEGDVVSEDDD